MLIFLYGPDDYRRLQKKRELVAEFRKKRSDFGLAFFDLAGRGAAKGADAGSWIERFGEFAASQLLFEPAKLAILENSFEVEAKELAEILEPFVGNKSVTILLSEREKPVKALGFLLEKPAVSQKFENLAGAEWLRFVGGEAKRAGVKLAPDAAQFLAAVYAGNSWALATELQKLAAYKPAGGGVGTRDNAGAAAIAKKDLNAFDLEAAPNYWTLLNGLKSSDVRARLGTLERLFAMNDAPAKIFNILAAQAGQKSPQFAEFDFMVKSGKLEYEETLVDLAIG